MKLEGIITAMATPLDDGEKINPNGVKKLVNRLIDRGISGLFILGTNGEFYSMDYDQKLSFAKMVVEEVNGRIPIYAGTGGINTDEVIKLTNEMSSIGVTAVSVITPFLISISQEELYVHYERIAKECSLPIILYNIPSNTRINIEPETVQKLSKLDKIIGIKDSSGNLENMKEYLELTKSEDFSVLVGSDSRILEALQLGATGAVAATSNVLTNTDVGIYQAYREGNIEKAEQLQKSIDEYRRILKLGSVPSVLKHTLNLIGQEVGNPFPPVLPVTDKEKIDDIKETLEKYNKIELFWEWEL